MITAVVWAASSLVVAIVAFLIVFNDGKAGNHFDRKDTWPIVGFILAGPATILVAALGGIAVVSKVAKDWVKERITLNPFVAVSRLGNKFYKPPPESMSCTGEEVPYREEPDCERPAAIRSEEVQFSAEQAH